MGHHRMFHHLTDGEIHQIEILCREGLSIPQVARILGRHKSSIYTLLKVNNVPYNQKQKDYRPNRKIPGRGKCKIQINSSSLIHTRKKRRSQASIRYCRIEPGGDLEKYMLQKLQLYWSPKQIAGSWKKKTGESLSKDTIYQHLYTHYKKDEIKKYLRRRGKRYRNRRKESILRKYCIQDRIMIDERPEIVNQRERIGDWEADTIVGKGGEGRKKGFIATFVDRKTGYALMRKLEQPNSTCMHEATKRVFGSVPSSHLHSITYDNGLENAAHYKLRHEMNIQTYFCYPYHSWEKGSIENLNMLIRQFIPKGTDFSTITEQQLQHYQDLLNSRPRERLNYRTPHEVFWESRNGD